MAESVETAQKSSNEAPSFLNFKCEEETEASIQEKKRAEMLKHLGDLNNARLQQSQSRKSETLSAPVFESVETFLKRFSQTKQKILKALDEYLEKGDNQERTLVKSGLETLRAEIADLEKLVAEGSYFLPSYEVRAARNTIAELKERLDDANSKLLPKKKFSFRNKGSETGMEGGLRALFIHRLKGCQVFAGPVMGSVLIEEAENCVFVLASHQIRIHQTVNTDFYLRVRSRPIVEYTSNVRFAPYALFYRGIDEELQKSDLKDETGMWANVDDFRWLRAVASPNWSIVPEADRLPLVDISDIKAEETALP
ncbi:hypothetical protein SUGI_0955480 [Cryptomeria japonica]|nr:hypothetical protein SUGI_0955480 [Cryptomeria japonica]